MKTAFFVVAFTAAVVTAAVTEQTKKTPAPDRFYLIANSAYYGASANTCEASDWRLATLSSQTERKQLQKHLDEHAISKVWVGATIDSSKPECKGQIPFNKNCWVWDGLDETNPPIVEANGLTWEAGIETKQQNKMSRVYYNVLKDVLNIEDNTNLNPAVCEKYK